MKRPMLAFLACATLATPAAAAEDAPTLAKLGPTVSYVSLEGGQETVAYGLLADLGSLTPDWRFGATADLWSKTRGGSGGYELSLRDVAVGARVMYHVPVQSRRVDPALGTGLAVHFLHTKLASGYSGNAVTDDRTRIGLDVAGEIGFKLGPHVDLVLQTTYRVIADDSSGLTVDTANQFYAGAGLLFGGAGD